MQSNNPDQNAGALVKNETKEQDIYKILNDCTKDITRFRQFIFYVGTSCDNKKLRDKLKCLQDKIFKNIIVQKDSIIKFFKSSLVNKSSTPGSLEQDKTERLICFTLATLSYLETLLIKLNSLFKVFPTFDSNEFINLGFEDVSINANEETLETVDIPVTIENQPNSKRFSLTETAEIVDLKNRIAYVQCLKEEIEHMDTNLIRYNVKSDSSDFIKKIKEFNEDPSVIVNVKDTHNDIKPNKPNVFRCCIKLQCTNEFRRKRICVLVIIALCILIIAAIACGLVFGLKT